MARLLQGALVVAVIFWVNVTAKKIHSCHFSRTQGSYAVCLVRIMELFRPELVAQTEPLKIDNMEGQVWNTFGEARSNTDNYAISNITVRSASRISCKEMNYRKTSDFKLTDPPGTEAIDIAVSCFWPPESFEVTMDIEFYSKPFPDVKASVGPILPRGGGPSKLTNNNNNKASATARITFKRITFSINSRWMLTKAMHSLKLRPSQPKGEISEEGIDIQLNIRAQDPHNWENATMSVAHKPWDEIKKKLLEETDSWYQKFVFPSFSNQVTGTPFAEL